MVANVTENRGKGLFRKSGLLMLITILGIFGVASLVAYNLWDRMVAETVRSNDLKAGLVSKVFVEHERAAIGVLRSYAARPMFINAIKKKDRNQALWHLQTLASNSPGIEHIFLTDPAGTLWINFPTYRETWNKNLSFGDWYKGVSKEWKPYVSGVYKMIVGQKVLAISISVPGFDESGKVIGILNASQTTGSFQKIIDEMGVDIDSKITLIDRAGQIIYSNRFPYKKEVVNYPPFPFLKTALAGERGNVEIRDFSDQDRAKFLSFAPVEGLGWSVFVEKAKGDIFQSQFEEFIAVAVISGLMALLVLLTGWHYQQGQRQIMELARLNQQLDARVKERTAELETSNEKLKSEIEQRREAEGGLRQSEGRQRAIFDALPSRVFAKDLHGQYLFCNRQTEIAAGRPSGEILGKTDTELFPPDLAKTFTDFDREVLIARKSVEREVSFPLADGSIKTHIATKFPLLGNDGRPYAIACVSTDITERKRMEEELIRSTRMKSEILESIQDGFFALDHNWCFSYINRRAATNVGLEPQDFLGKNIWRMFPQLKGTAHEINYRKAVESKEVQRFEMHGVLRDLWYTMSVYPSEEGISVYFQDITQRKRMETELKEAAEKYSTLFNTTSDGVWIHNLRGEIVEVNDAYCQMSGYSRDELTHMPISKLEGRETPEEIARHIKELVEGGGHENFESRHRRKDGSIFDVDITALYFEKDGGRIAVFVRDVSERKKAEQALRDSEAKANALIKYAPTGIYEIDYRGPRFISVNDAMCRILGYTREELFSIGPSALLDERSRVLFAERIKRRLAGEEIEESVEFRVWKKDGSTIDAILNVSVNLGGNPNRALVVAHDITERKRMEEAFRQSREAYRQLVEGSGSVILRVDPEMRITFMNQYGLQFFGYTREEMIGQKALGTIIPLVDDEGRDLAGMAEDLMRHPDRYVTNVHQNMRRDGTLVWMSWANRPIYDGRGIWSSFWSSGMIFRG